MYRFFSQVFKLTGINIATVGIAHGLYTSGERLGNEISKRYTLFTKPKELSKECAPKITCAISK